MKHAIVIITIAMITPLFALVGFGAYGDIDMLEYPSGISGDLETSGVQSEGFNGARAFGFLFYIDAFPIVDIEFDIEFAGNLYKYTPYVLGQPLETGDMPWGRVSTYMSLRKEIVGLSIPFLAKAQLYGGLGFNKHTVTPIMTTDLIQSAFPSTSNLDDALNQSTSNKTQIEALGTYMLDHSIKASGFHLQAGVRAKLLMLNAFINARYTIAEDVIPGKSGFPSLWFGLALGI